MADELKELVLDRETWLRGDYDKSVLRDADGRMCCLGFLGLACGVSPDKMLYVPMPDDMLLDDYSIPWPEGLLFERDGGGWRNSKLCNQITTINDEAGVSDDERVAQLQPLFEKLGYRLTVKP